MKKVVIGAINDGIDDSRVSYRSGISKKIIIQTFVRRKTKKVTSLAAMQASRFAFYVLSSFNVTNTDFELGTTVIR